ncbi:phenylacetic acid degradation protein [Sphingomonas turrisvirgatae]|uniref:Phenylacetic acid degradation protein n=1 Tax=Sphingomonas turrisvirgatae TaxID=1888892 RepID=A0A1E3LSC1_9SPHN|nr:phenylacetic acid degradation protein [Sphingomonas turrisvirgatae]
MLPPYAKVLGVTIEAGEGAPLLSMPFGEDVLGRPGFVHGGALAGLLELAAIAALAVELEAAGREDVGYKPINVTVDFMRGGRDNMTFAQGRVVRLGSRIANVEAAAWQDARDRPVASARMNFLISGSASA